MPRFLRRFWAWIVQIEETQGVVVWLLSPLGGLSSMISAYLSGLAWHEILFWGSGVFAFLMIGLFYAWTWRQTTTLFEKLRLMDVRVIDIIKGDEDSGKIGILTQYRFQNTADVPMYFHLTKANVSIDGHINPKAELETSVTLIQPHDYHFITAAGIPDIEEKEVLMGSADFNIYYGPKRDKLRYLLEHEGALDLRVIPAKEERQVHVSARMSHKRVEHVERVLAAGAAVGTISDSRP